MILETFGNFNLIRAPTARGVKRVARLIAIWWKGIFTLPISSSTGSVSPRVYNQKGIVPEINAKD